MAYTLNERNTKREIEGVLEACRTLRQNHGLLISFDEERSMKINDTLIDIIPIHKWLIRDL
ncbi:MAG: hypothetical protein J7L41_07785 [Synergistetes bacterium]|nr:hypothetical protein [Synergistota bacterium]